MNEKAIEVATERPVQIRELPKPRSGERPSGEQPHGDQHNGDQPDPAVQVAQLDRRVSRLERLLHGNAHGAAPDADTGPTTLELADPDLAELAAAAEYSQTLSQMLATPAVRAACEQAIEAWEQWQLQHAEARELAVAASRTIAITASDQDGHLGAVQAFEEARAQLAALLACRRQYLNTASHARAQLAHDQEVRERYQLEIDTGHTAWTTLTARLQLSTASAVERSEPLPAWLVVALGPPPTTTTRWVELAAQLLAYRFTYAVTDPTDPLGAPPTADDSQRRRRWYRELEYRLAGWRDSS